MLRGNLLFEWVRKTSDHGPVNSWDRMPWLTDVRNGSASLIPAFHHIHGNFIHNGGSMPIDTDDGSNRLNVTNNVVVGGALWKDGIANSHKRYAGNVELFGSNCFNSGQWDQGSSNFTSNHCFVHGRPSTFNCNCNVSGPPGAPCPVMAHNHYYQQNEYTVCGKTLPQIQAEGLELGSVVAPVPAADDIVKLIKTQLGMA